MHFHFLKKENHNIRIASTHVYQIVNWFWNFHIKGKIFLNIFKRFFTFLLKNIFQKFQHNPIIVKSEISTNWVRWLKKSSNKSYWLTIRVD